MFLLCSFRAASVRDDVLPFDVVVVSGISVMSWDELASSSRLILPPPAPQPIGVGGRAAEPRVVVVETCLSGPGDGGAIETAADFFV